MNTSRAFAVASFGAALVLAAAAQPADRVREARKAVTTIIHLAADGSEVIRGNGFLIGPDGLVLSNAHLVAKAAKLRIQLAGGDVYDQVTLRALDAAADLAILKIPAFNAPFVPLARRALPEPGAPVQAAPRIHAEDKPGAAQSRVIAAYSPASGAAMFSVEMQFNAATKGCPVFDANGDCLGVSTLAYRTERGGGIVVSINRVLDLLAQNMNQPLETMDWSAWKSGEEGQPLPPGLRRVRPNPELWAEKRLAHRLEMALEFDPSDRQIELLLARAYIQERNYKRAADRLAEVLAEDPAAIPALTVKGDLLHHTGEYDEARRIYQGIVERGHQSPHNYEKQLRAVQLHHASHEHAIGGCGGALALGAEEFSFLPSFGPDRFSIAYGQIKQALVKTTLQAAQPLYEFNFRFNSPASNRDKTWNKTEFQIRFSEPETSRNLLAYLRSRGVQMLESEKR